MGFARRLQMSELKGPVGKTWYVPHGLVEQPNKPGKPRLVFDARSKFNNICLNDALHNGPLLMADMLDVLFFFREKPHAVSMDINKMFLQRRPGVPGIPIAHQMLVLIFGASSSPTCAAYVLRHIIEDHPEYADVAELIAKKFYADNYLDSFNTIEEGIATCRRLRELLFLGGFVLGQMVTSAREILQSLPATERANPDLNIDLDALPVHRTLGLEWNGEGDHFFFTLVIPTAITKRQVLSAVSAIYDPMGFRAAVTITAQVLLQDAWCVGRDVQPDERRPKKLGCDHQLPPDLQEWWDCFVRSLESLRELRVPRCLRPTSFPANDTTITLHLFCDASLFALGASLLQRSEYRGKIALRLVAARSRVAPVKQQTLTRLELMAALLGARLLKRYLQLLQFPCWSHWCWSDSNNVLYWLRSEATLYAQFISSRKEQILSVSPASRWRHVPSELNPADDLSRGIEASELTEGHQSLAGPAFLLMGEEEWPQRFGGGAVQPEALEIVRPVAVCEEVRVNVVVVTEAGASSLPPLTIGNLIESSTTLSALKRSVAGLNAAPGEELTPSLLRAGLDCCIKMVQKSAFASEINALAKGNQIGRDSPLRKLSPFLDSDGLLRVGGRLQHATMNEDAKHPVILPHHHKLTRLIIVNTHESRFHDSTERTLYEQCRGRLLWPTARSSQAEYEEKVRGAIHLPRHEGCPPEASQHPGHRLMPHGLASLRSSARLPKNVWSDNGTNLTACEKELKKGLARIISEGRLVAEMADKGINWQFSPPSASHFGGSWESLVKSAKSALKVVLGTTTVNEEVLRTVLAEVIAILDARPLTHLSVDPEHESPLNPNHFLLGRAHPHIPPDLFDEDGPLSRKRWKQAQEITIRFWRRWMTEYVPSLMERRKWTRKSRNVQVGDLVLIVDQNAPRGTWLTGTVSRLLPAKSSLPSGEQVVRTVWVKTTTGEYRRPVVKLCLLRRAMDSSF
ncbi:uncharacterized protein LOC123466896 [Daphnia magna]|uniref:uncharacterized protein LOC123466896 n=1 Tax=Daphnia magna TaxID=35525 RepID=UPI001E1BC1D5|nr:uncharacterized protein LOC123466896 [Daphnia magna]